MHVPCTCRLRFGSHSRLPGQCQCHEFSMLKTDSFSKSKKIPPAQKKIFQILTTHPLGKNFVTFYTLLQGGLIENPQLGAPQIYVLTFAITFIFLGKYARTHSHLTRKTRNSLKNFRNMFKFMLCQFWAWGFWLFFYPETLRYSWNPMTPTDKIIHCVWMQRNLGILPLTKLKHTLPCMLWK